MKKHKKSRARRAFGRLSQMNKVLRLQCRNRGQLRKYDATQIHEG